MLRIEGMNTHYGASHILQGVDLDMPQGRISARARPQRCRQDDDGEDASWGSLSRAAGACMSEAPTSPAGHRIAWRAKVWPTCPKDG